MRLVKQWAARLWPSTRPAPASPAPSPEARLVPTPPLTASSPVNQPTVDDPVMQAFAAFRREVPHGTWDGFLGRLTSENDLLRRKIAAAQGDLARLNSNTPFPR